MILPGRGNLVYPLLPAPNENHLGEKTIVRILLKEFRHRGKTSDPLQIHLLPRITTGGGGVLLTKFHLDSRSLV